MKWTLLIFSLFTVAKLHVIPRQCRVKMIRNHFLFWNGRHISIGQISLFDLAWEMLGSGDYRGLRDRVELEVPTGILVVRLEYLKLAIEKWLRKHESEKQLSMAA